MCSRIAFMLTTPTVEQGIEIGALGLGAALLGALYLLVLLSS